MKRRLIFSLAIVLVFVLLFQVVLADWGGGGAGAPGASDTDDDDDDDENEPSGTDLATACSSDDTFCSALNLDIGIYCYSADRDAGESNAKKTTFWSDQWYGVDSESAGGLSSSTNLYVVEAEERIIEVFHDDGNPYEYSWLNSYTTETPWFTGSTDDDPRLYRFEGKGSDSYSSYLSGLGCRPYAAFFSTYNELKDTKWGIDNNNDFSINFGDWDVPSTWTGEWITIYGVDLGTDVVWDENSTDCEIIGGEWLSESGYTNQACCGDDYVWVNNRPLKEEERERLALEYDNSYGDTDYLEDNYNNEDLAVELATNYCLYGIDDDDAIISIDLFTNYYECLDTKFNQYDDAVKDAEDYPLDYPDECYDDEDNLLSTCAFLIDTSYDEPTDLGKWSTPSSTNPSVCRISSPVDETKGVPQFAWTNAVDAGELAVDIYGNEITDFRNEAQDTLCESYLGGKWTGAHCCGNKYDYSDVIDSYNYGHEDEYFGESFSDPTPIYWYEGNTEDIYANYACVQGAPIDSKETAVYTADDGSEIELLNLDGYLYGCNIGSFTVLGVDYYEITPLVEEDSDYDVESCELLEEKYLCNYNPDTTVWEWYEVTGGDEGDYVKDTLRYSSGDEFKSSTAEWAYDEGYSQDSACCAGSTCWDGDECVNEYTIYYYGGLVAGEQDEDDDKVAICSAGTWQTEVEEKYDWFYNTDAESVDYCANAYACACSSNDDDSTFCTENEDYVNAGCTLEPYFYKDDHFCEALDTDGDGSYDDSSRWTSRTKLLAFQLLDIASTTGTDFTLFCSDYTTAVNNYDKLESVKNDINSVCVLNQNDEVTVGITLNSDDEDEPMEIDVDDLLFGSSNGILDDIFESDVEDCDSALGLSSTEQFGEFYSCDGSTINAWYNKEINALIYSKDGLSYTAVLDYPDTETWQDMFDTYKSIITTSIDDASSDGTLVNPDETDLTDYFTEFNYIEDYNNIYYSNQGSSTIFGFQEIKYSEKGDSNRYYMATLYDYGLDCDQIYAPYETSWTIYCNNDNNLVLERSTTGSEHWNDLTAAIRIE